LQSNFWSKDFFEKAGQMLNSDKDLTKAFSGINTTILVECSDRQAAYVIGVADGKITSKEAKPDEKAEFRFSAPYDEWARILKDESKIQGEVVRGRVKFRGSMPKMLLYLSRVVKMEGKIMQMVKSMDLRY